MTMHGANRRPGFRARVRAWSARHPLATLGIGLFLAGWLLIYEIVRIIHARHTVAHDWAAGVVAGGTAALVITGAITVLAHRSRRTHKLGAMSVLIVVATASAALIFRLTTSRVPGYSVRPTNWVEVAGLAYVAVFAAVSLYLLGWAVLVYWRKRRGLRAGAAGQAAELRADRPQH
jgi:hypothetical protein